MNARLGVLAAALTAATSVLFAQAATPTTTGSAPVVVPAAPDVDVRPLITAVDAASAEQVRGRLMAEVWPDGLPATQPDGALIVRMPYGIDSHLQLLLPTGTPTCATVVWHGHSDDTPGIAKLATALVDAGCVVVVGWMPMFGPNPQPEVPTPLGAVQLTDRHDQLQLVEGTTSTLALFLTPVAAAVNLLIDRWPDLPVAMVGLSGGGWTTTVYAALDERVRLSAPVAGSLPDFLRAWDRAGGDRGDYEQVHPALPDYLDLYVLATTDGRQQQQVLIDGDPCCFDAAGGRHLVYEATVSQLAAGLGGMFDVAVYPQQEHAIGHAMRTDLVELLASQAVNHG